MLVLLAQQAAVMMAAAGASTAQVAPAVGATPVRDGAHLHPWPLQCNKRAAFMANPYSHCTLKHAEQTRGRRSGARVELVELLQEQAGRAGAPV